MRAMNSPGGAATGRRPWCVVVLALVAVAVAPQAAAGQTLSPVTVGDFAAVTLDGGTTSTTADMSAFSVTDSAGFGWNVTVSATPFAELDGAGQYVSGGRTLPAGSLVMPAPTVSPASALVA